MKQHPELLIIALTMREDEHYDQELFKIGIMEYVLKKSTRTETLQAVRSAYNGDVYIDPSPSLMQLMLSPYVGKKKP